MLPSFLVEETIVRESGEGAVFAINQDPGRGLLLTFSITHAVEQQSIRFEIRGSEDGRLWYPKPLLQMAPKCYCGDYQAVLAPSSALFLKAAWHVDRWARHDRRPYFRFHIFAEPAPSRTAFAGAA